MQSDPLLGFISTFAYTLSKVFVSEFCSPYSDLGFSMKQLPMKFCPAHLLNPCGYYRLQSEITPSALFVPLEIHESPVVTTKTAISFG
jgi:hypothetical protein